MIFTVIETIVVGAVVVFLYAANDEKEVHSDNN